MITINDLKKISKLSNKTIKELRAILPERAFNGRLTKYQLIYQIVFKADAPDA